MIDPDNQTGPVAAPAALELWSDGRIADLGDQVLRAGETIEYHRVGSMETENIGIASIAAQRPYDALGQVQVFVAIENPTDVPRTADLQLSVNGVVRSITARPVEIPPFQEQPGLGRVAGRKQFSFAPFDQERDAIIEVLVLGEDGQPIDDVAGLIVPPAKRLRVAVVDAQSFVLRSILEGMALESLDLLDRAEFERLAETGELDAYDVIVLDDAEVEKLPPGRYLSFGRTPPIEGITEFGSPASGVIVRRSSEDHPVLRYVNLDELYVSTMRKVTTGPGVTTLVESGDGALVVALDRGPIQMIHVTFDPLDSNWPYLRSFVKFRSQRRRVSRWSRRRARVHGNRARRADRDEAAGSSDGDSDASSRWDGGDRRDRRSDESGLGAGSTSRALRVVLGGAGVDRSETQDLCREPVGRDRAPNRCCGIDRLQRGCD